MNENEYELIIKEAALYCFRHCFRKFAECADLSDEALCEVYEKLLREQSDDTLNG